jgi:3-deoxy-D-manno-octulosonate 8-phosphate phosphatase (KDO 8-P phosphatase)
VIEWIPPKTLDNKTLARAARVRMAIFDVDGVLTDGSLHYGPDGEVVKVFNTLDGHGIKMLKQSGVEPVIISGRNAAAVSKRAQDLGIQQCFLGVDDKGAVYRLLRESLNIKEENVAAIGDDVVDLPILIHCGFSACVPSAPSAVQNLVHYVTRADGGRGAVREFCEIILHAQGHLEPMLQKYVE